MLTFAILSNASQTFSNHSRVTGIHCDVQFHINTANIVEGIINLLLLIAMHMRKFLRLEVPHVQYTKYNILRN